MGLLKKLTSRVFSSKPKEDNDSSKKELLRRCYFEVMEQRRVLSADPVIAAVTYLEGDAGQDTTPDHFEVTFEGGSDSTHLTQFTINGDQDQSGNLSDGDMFFDYNDQQPGAGSHHDFQFDAANSIGVDASDIRSVTFGEDGLSLTIEVANFEQSDVFAFTVDVDEVERFRTDKIASGVEFEGSFFTADFVDENYTFDDKEISTDVVLDGGFVQTQREGIFYDEYDQMFSAGQDAANGIIELTRDNQEGQRNRTAGAVDAYDLVAKPISIEGTIYHDENVNCEHDGNEDGIAGVKVSLEKLNEQSGLYEAVATTRTDANGDYSFGEELGLTPGTYQLVEGQPDGFLDVGASAGSEGGVVEQTVAGDKNVISDINIPLGGTAATDYDFKEVRPATLSGNVWHDENNDGVFDPNEQGIANVLIEVTRVGAKSGAVEDVFANTDTISVRTDANGHYSVEQLPPGIYQIVEVNNYPDGSVDPLAGFIDGKDSIGTVAASSVGAKTNDRFSQIELCADDEGVEYNFGEIKPAQISGFVSVSTPEGNCTDPTSSEHVGIEGVTIELYNDDGGLVATTLTGDRGFYSFDSLPPGTYSIVEIQPDGYLDGGQHIGNVDLAPNGNATNNDSFTAITLGSGDEGVRYDFCEHIPAELCGTVYHDRNNNGQQDTGEEGISGVTIQLFDVDGNVTAETVTDSDGAYCFLELYPGEYTVMEMQPGDYIDGIDSVGSVNGNATGLATVNDKFTNVTLVGGDKGVQYDFGEIRPGSISGQVHTDANGNCTLEVEEGERPLVGAELELLDANDNVIATTVTDINGNYSFGGLLPGEYSIRQIQPDGLFSGGETVGDGGGSASTNLLEGIVVGSDQQLVNYDFCEVEAAEIHGRVWEDGPAITTADGQPVEGYRNLRDGIYQQGVDTPLSGVRMQLYFYVDEANGSVIPRPVTLGEVQAEHYQHLGTTDPNAAVWVDTMANGEYWFEGLPAGSYIVLQTQPNGYFDSNDTPGTTTGFSYNSLAAAATAPQAVISTFSSEQIMDSVVNIYVNAGQVSQFNNFSEVSFNAEPPSQPQPPTPPQPPSQPARTPPSVGPTGHPGLMGAQPSSFTQFIGTSRGASFETQAGGGQPYTWHLSVINGGQPRGLEDGAGGEDSVWLTAGYIGNEDWNRFDMDDAVWSFTETRDLDGEIVSLDKQTRFGMIGGTPLSGDFDGDGTDELAVFKDGYWMIDINRNGLWDDSDLLARLGDASDQPVVGDWDGDGKDDIGIYGPIWERDREAIDRDPGLPNPDNDVYSRPKNVPPVDGEATNGARVMKLTNYGKQRADVVDHVFGYGDRELIAVTGDWNGNGVRSIGTFQDGVWELDVNGDGRFDGEDTVVQFGRAGDVPVVGDFNGDGIEEIAVYRSGTWMIDVDGNRELDATDKTFEMGEAGDRPIVGDWDGDGVDEPGVYHEDPTIRFD